MAPSGRFNTFRKDGWILSVHTDRWREEFLTVIIDRIRTLSAAKHPQTLDIALPGIEARCFLKVFHAFSGAAAVKDFFRPSKAFRALKAAEALTQARFNVAPVIAAGEERSGGFLRRSFIVTSAIEATALPSVLRDTDPSVPMQENFRRKIDSIKAMAEEVRRFHDLGFVHGDLIPPNIFVAGETGALRFFFMDNDRTRRYPRRLPQQLWKRNLIQLNRFPLPGITLQDRMRFFHFYLGRKKLTARHIMLVRRLEQRTRRRRKQCDGVDVSGSFRALMQWRPTVPANS